MTPPDTAALSDAPGPREAAWPFPTDGEYSCSGYYREDVQVHGDRLIALSPTGVTLADVSNPADVRRLGHRDVGGRPFALFVSGPLVLALANDWAEGTGTNGVPCRFNGRVVALDATDPAHPRELGELRIPGTLTDARLANDILYLASEQVSGSAAPRTLISSVRVHGTGLSPLAELPFDGGADDAHGGLRTTFAHSHLYVSQQEPDPTGAPGTTLSAIATGDPVGRLEVSSRLRIDGSITQINELGATLRVLSQPPNGAPVLQTFAMPSTGDLVPAGRLELPLASGQLEQAFFDGERAYVSSTAAAAGLLRIDLAEPTAPRSLGVIPVPGSILDVHAELDRALVLYADGGALHMALVELSDAEPPKVAHTSRFSTLATPAFPGYERIADGITVVDEGLAIAIHRGRVQTPHCADRNWSGAQLIGTAPAQLQVRGRADHLGPVERALVRGNVLFTLAGDRIRTFDITDRQTPVALDEFWLTRYVQQSAPLNDHVARITTETWNGSQALDITSSEHAELADAEGSLPLGPDFESCSREVTGSRLFTRGSHAFVWREIIGQDHSFSRNRASLLLSVDGSTPRAPRVVKETSLGVLTLNSQRFTALDDVTPSGNVAVQVGTTLVFTRTKQDPSNDTVRTGAVLETVDVSQPDSPTLSTVDVAESLGMTGLHVDGTQVVFSRYAPAAEGRVRFYLERYDVSPGGAPRRAAPIPAPGSLLVFDSQQRRALMVGYERQPLPRETCENETPGSYWATLESGECITLRYTAYRVRVGASSVTIEAKRVVPESVPEWGIAKWAETALP